MTEKTPKATPKATPKKPKPAPEADPRGVLTTMGGGFKLFIRS